MGDEWFNDQGYAEMANQPGRGHLALVMHFEATGAASSNCSPSATFTPCSSIVPPAATAPGLAPRCCCRCSGSIAIESSPTSRPKATWSMLKLPLTAGQLEPVFELIDENGGIEGFMREVMRSHRRTRPHSGRSAGRLSAPAARSPGERSSGDVAVAQQRLGDNHRCTSLVPSPISESLASRVSRSSREIGDVAVAAVDLHRFDR